MERSQLERRSFCLSVNSQCRRAKCYLWRSLHLTTFVCKYLIFHIYVFIPFSVMLSERLNETCPKIRLFNNRVGVEMIPTQVRGYIILTHQILSDSRIFGQFHPVSP